MEVFRISTTKYSGSLTASGKSARWNKDNQHALYTGESRSLSALELVVHKSIGSALIYKVMVISIADDEDLFTRLHIKDLPSNWRETAAYPRLQDIGSNWYTSNKSLILQVPSVIVSQEFNYIINTKHSAFLSEIKLIRTEDFMWDDRLLV